VVNAGDGVTDGRAEEVAVPVCAPVPVPVPVAVAVAVACAEPTTLTVAVEVAVAEAEGGAAVGDSVPLSVGLPVGWAAVGVPLAGGLLVLVGSCDGVLVLVADGAADGAYSVSVLPRAARMTPGAGPMANTLWPTGEPEGKTSSRASDTAQPLPVAFKTTSALYRPMPPPALGPRCTIIAKTHTLK
jgi:hypothetical protein